MTALIANAITLYAVLKAWRDASRQRIVRFAASSTALYAVQKDGRVLVAGHDARVPMPMTRRPVGWWTPLQRRLDGYRAKRRS